MNRHQRRRTNADQQKAQARRTAFERYEIDYSGDVPRRIEGQINGNEYGGVHLEKRSSRMHIWGVLYNGEHVPVRYDKERTIIVEFLPLSDLDEILKRNPDRREDLEASRTWL